MFPRTVTFPTYLVIVVLLNPGAKLVAAHADVDPELPEYKKAEKPLEGHLVIGGSGTMERFVKPLAEEFCKRYPKNVTSEIEVRGSTQVPGGLKLDAMNVGLMSRQMNEKEKADFKTATHNEVIEITVAVDAILVLVHKDNPVEGITLPQLDALYGTKRLAGYDKKINTWGDLGVKGDLAAAKILPYGILEENNGTVETFRRIVLRDGPLNQEVGNIKYPEREFGQTVAKVPNGISYNIDHPPVEGAKAVRVAEKAGGPYVLADWKTVGDGSYPLRRQLYVYLRDKDNPAVVEFLRFVLSRDGQRIISANGAISLPAREAEKQRTKLLK